MTFDIKDSYADLGDNCFKVGNYDLSPRRRPCDARAHFGLSHREVELLVWVGAGLTRNQIAERMGVSPSTADTFRRRAYVKLGVGTSAAAIAILFSFLSGTQVEPSDLAPAV